MFFERGDDPDAGYIDTFKEGFTPPPGVFFLFILVTGMLATSLSGGILGSFISALVVLCRRLRINPGESTRPESLGVILGEGSIRSEVARVEGPARRVVFLNPSFVLPLRVSDNISTPIAACLSDLVTLFILGIVGTLLLPYINTPIPFFFLPLLILAGAGFAWSTLRNEYVKGLVRDGWTPLLAAVTISSATGMVLERCVGRYEGYAILAVAMTGESRLSRSSSFAFRLILASFDIAHLPLPFPLFVVARSLIQVSQEPSDRSTPLVSQQSSIKPTHPLPSPTQPSTQATPLQVLTPLTSSTTLPKNLQKTSLHQELSPSRSS